MQALDRKDPVLPLSPGRAERHGFEYFRHGALSRYVAFNTSEVLRKTAERHTFQVEDFLEAYHRVHLHFTPTSRESS